MAVRDRCWRYQIFHKLGCCISQQERLSLWKDLVDEANSDDLQSLSLSTLLVATVAFAEAPASLTCEAWELGYLHLYQVPWIIVADELREHGSWTFQPCHQPSTSKFVSLGMSWSLEPTPISWLKIAYQRILSLSYWWLAFFAWGAGWQPISIGQGSLPLLIEAPCSFP